ncbi:presenilin [Anaeramoeba ignava]|uniref:Presenilin n=1 Tax=Anaeramoeba ignava TaxID=1746090 RepID=A0A9Q0LAR5_ANAIG|nr:presenilin [Anaeramoeba ignava]
MDSLSSQEELKESDIEKPKKETENLNENEIENEIEKENSQEKPEKETEEQKKKKYWDRSKIRRMRQLMKEKRFEVMIQAFTSSLKRILIPVSITMILTVILIKTLYSDQTMNNQFQDVSVYNENSSDSGGKKFAGSLLNALIIVGAIVVMTFLIVLCFKFGCMNLVFAYIIFSTFIMLGIIGAVTFIELLVAENLGMDWLSFVIFMLNFAVVGVTVIFWKGPEIFNKMYLIAVSVLVAKVFASLPEWTAWILLGAIAIWDIFAVLSARGPLKVLIETAQQEDKPIAGLLYNSSLYFENDYDNDDNDNDDENSDKNHESSSDKDHKFVDNPYSTSSDEDNFENDTNQPKKNEEIENKTEDNNETKKEDQDDDLIKIPKEVFPERKKRPETKKPEKVQYQYQYEDEDEGGIKLGLGDFIFYSVLIAKASLNDYSTVFTCFIAILTGLSLTLFFLIVYQKALPALPISISFGIIFYFLTKLVLDPFIEQLGNSSVFA